MEKITPYLWFDSNGEEAVNHYIDIFSSVGFKDCKIGNILRYDEQSSEVSGMPVGSVLTIDLYLAGQMIGVLNGGPAFKFSPAASFSVSCSTVEEVDALFQKLSADGKILMELAKYPFSEKYGWCEDKYGVSWQIGVGEAKQKIVPSFLFVGDKNGKAEEAVNRYVSFFENSKINLTSRYEKGEGGDEGTLKYCSFTIDGYDLIAMDSSFDHKFTFTQAFSLQVNCKDQKEVDHLWESLSEGGEQQPCGWLIDKYGIAWQIAPTILNEMLKDPDPAKAKRVMGAMLEMTKIDIAELEKAYNQE